MLIEEQRDDETFETVQRFLSVEASFDEYIFDANGTFTSSQQGKESVLEGLESICGQFSVYSTVVCDDDE